MEEPGLRRARKGDWRGGVDSRLEWVWWANCSPQWTQALITEGWQRGELRLRMRSCSGWNTHSCKLHPFISWYLRTARRRLWLPVLSAYGCQKYSDIYHSFPRPFASFIVLHISVFFVSVKNLATPPSNSSLCFLTSLRFFPFLIFFCRYVFFFFFLRCSCRPNLLTLTFTIGRITFSRRSRTLMMQAHRRALAPSARRSLHLISPSDRAEPQQQITKGV